MVLVAMFSMLSISAVASTSVNMTDAQKIESLQQEVNGLRQIILQSQAAVRPMCLTTGERCESRYDICCSDGQYCFMGSVCR